MPRSANGFRRLISINADGWADRPYIRFATRAVQEDSPLALEHNEEISDADLERVLHIVPRGAFVLTSLAVGILLIAWLAVYFFVFLPRGPIG